MDGNVAKIDLAARGVDGALVHFNAPSWAVRAVMSSTTLPVCPKTGSTSPSLTVHLCLHTALLREIGNAPVVGCLQFSSPAWRMAVRDRWVGWDDRTRARNLQRVVNNSRFLLLPWVAVKNLASAVLARGLSQLVVDWPRHYHVEPWLMETLVDPVRHHGGCYRAANWVAVGATSGRGRMDRHGRRGGEAPKTVLVYHPVVRNAQRRLRES